MAEYRRYTANITIGQRQNKQTMAHLNTTYKVAVLIHTFLLRRSSVLFCYLSCCHVIICESFNVVKMLLDHLWNYTIVKMPCWNSHNCISMRRYKISRHHFPFKAQTRRTTMINHHTSIRFWESDLLLCPAGRSVWGVCWLAPTLYVSCLVENASTWNFSSNKI